MDSVPGEQSSAGKGSLAAGNVVEDVAGDSVMTGSMVALDQKLSLVGQGEQLPISLGEQGRRSLSGGLKSSHRGGNGDLRSPSTDFKQFERCYERQRRRQRKAGFSSGKFFIYTISPSLLLEQAEFQLGGVSSEEDAQQVAGPSRRVNEDQRWTDFEAMGFSVPTEVGPCMGLRGELDKLVGLDQ